MKEEYRDIEGYEGIYQISNCGRVKSLGNDKNRKEKILKPTKNNKGYLKVGLCKEGKRKMCLVHRLVAITFIDNPNNFTEINHKDENITNNCVNNLEWCTHFYNVNFGTRTEKTSKQVLCLETGVIYPSTMEVERQLGFSQGYISNVCNGKYNTAYGFHWKYVS